MPTDHQQMLGSLLEEISWTSEEFGMYVLSILEPIPAIEDNLGGTVHSKVWHPGSMEDYSNLLCTHGLVCWSLTVLKMLYILSFFSRLLTVKALTCSVNNYPVDSYRPGTVVGTGDAYSNQAGHIPLFAEPHANRDRQTVNTGLHGKSEESWWKGSRNRCG